MTTREFYKNTKEWNFETVDKLFELAMKEMKPSTKYYLLTDDSECHIREDFNVYYIIIEENSVDVTMSTCWNDYEEMKITLELMADFIVNHILDISVWKDGKLLGEELQERWYKYEKPW